ncbi:GNAT family N-acetyltransferase [Candidatus Bathyarchaeota archaeon]|nr:GNAT family N-acetyltransferase [Candidatus Bathyarchaeota archaeon]
MKTEFKIGYAVQGDKERLKKIICASFPRFLRFFADHSINSEGTVLVSEVKETVVGFAKLTEFSVGDGRFGCILWLAVHPDFRRKGVAAELVKAGTKCLLSYGAEAVFASVQRRNVASLATFDKEGFIRVGFLGLWRFFGWRVFNFYRKIWFVPSEAVLMHGGFDEDS